jgi:hypothetical protein
MSICPLISDFSDDEKEMVNVEAWFTQAEVKVTFDCQEVSSNGFSYPRFVCVCPYLTLVFGIWVVDVVLLLMPTNAKDNFCLELFKFAIVILERDLFG